MRAADTNVLVRILVRDDDDQTQAADSFVAEGAWVSLLVLQETIWVLERAYALDRNEQGVIVDMLLQHATIALEAPELVASALAVFRQSAKIEFSASLVLEVVRRSGHLPLVTFDKRLAKTQGAELLR